MNLRDAILEEKSWGLTANGADAKIETGSACLDLFGRAGAMRNAGAADKQLLFGNAFAEDPDIAVKLLFYIRDIRGGYGERDTFTDMLRKLAEISTDSVVKNLWAVLEYGRAKDLYCLIGTPAEDAMWAFMKDQFELDCRNMEENKSISLLAKWIATPDAKSEKTKALGKLTAKKLGYDFSTMRVYKTKLRALRKYLDLPEAKMCAGKWDEIEYSKCASQFMLHHRKAFYRHDSERFKEFIEAVNSGETTMHMGAATPVDIMHGVITEYSSDLEVMWSSLADVCKGNALAIVDTSGSMTWGCRSAGAQPIEVAMALGMYFAERNKGDLKDLFMTFETKPHFVEFKGATLLDKYHNAMRAGWGMSTNLEAAFDLLLDTCVRAKLKQEDLPEALIIISDMQINRCVTDVNVEGRMTFYTRIKNRYDAAGYRLPHVIFWNVNAANPTFHARKSDDGVSLVSGYSPNVFRDVMNNIGSTPYELMMAVIGSERYAAITA